MKLEDIMNPKEPRTSTFSGEKEGNIKNWKEWCIHNNIGERFFDVDLDSSLADAHLMGRVMTWGKIKPSEMKVLYLHGSAGCGKTHLGLACLRKVLENGGKSIGFLPAHHIVEIGKEKGMYQLEKVIGEYQWLMIDDLGVENAAEWEIKYIFGLLNSRYNNRLPTIVTSNVALGELKKRLSDRIVSRLAGTQIEFPETDWRKIL